VGRKKPLSSYVLTHDLMVSFVPRQVDILKKPFKGFRIDFVTDENFQTESISETSKTFPNRMFRKSVLYHAFFDT